MDQIFKALSAPIRREILSILSNGELSASEISCEFEVSKSTISHHLSILKDADLIAVRREKNTLYYRLKTSVVEDVFRFIYDLKEGKWE